MKPELQKIFDLAHHDTKIRALQAERDMLQQTRDESEASRARKRGEMEDKSGQLRELEKKRIDAEGEAQLMTSRLREFEGKLNQIKTNKEYQAALKEVADMKKSISEKEDLVLQVMTDVEAVKKEVEALTQESQTQAEALGQQLGELQEREKALEEQLAQLRQERGQILPQVESTLLSRYERIKQSRPEAIAVIDQGTCQGCSRKIPPQLLNEVRRGDKIHSCPSCSRLLYVAEPEVAKEVHAS